MSVRLTVASDTDRVDAFPCLSSIRCWRRIRYRCCSPACPRLVKSSFSFSALAQPDEPTPLASHGKATVSVHTREGDSVPFFSVCLDSAHPYRLMQPHAHITAVIGPRARPSEFLPIPLTYILVSLSGRMTSGERNLGRRKPPQTSPI